MLILIVILILSPFLAFLNYRFHKVFPDTESREYEDLKQRQPTKKEKTSYLDWAIIVVMVFLLCSCSNTRVIKGYILEVKQDTVKLYNHSFKVLKNVPKVNQYVTFTPTKDTAKVNCIKLK